MIRGRQRSLNQSKRAEVRPFDLERDIPRYPSYMDGLPAVSRDTVLATQSELLKKIQDEFETDDDYQRKVFNSALNRYAEVVHLLPASESDHHAQPGGLFRHGLEVAHLALKSAHNHAPFARSEYAERRKELNLRFRYAVMVAALCHDIGKPVTDINVMDSSGEIRWNPFGMTIPRWASKNGVDRYFVYWNRGRHRRHEPASLTMLDAIMGSRGKEFLTDVPSDILNETLEAITGDASPLNVIAKIVKQADSSSTSADKQQTVAVYGGTGIPVERYYLSAIRRLLKDHKWKPNKPGSPFWMIDKVPFLVWPAAGEAIAKVLKSDGVRGIPLDAETIARELLDRNLASPFVDDNNEKRTYWPIAPEALEKQGSAKKGIRLQALRMNSIDTITDEIVESTPGRYGGAIESAAPRAPEDAAAEDGSNPHQNSAGSRPEEAEKAIGQPENDHDASAGPMRAEDHAAAQKEKVPAESQVGAVPDAEAPPAHSKLKPAAPPRIPTQEPSRVVQKEGREELSAEDVSAFFTEHGFMGRILGAFADDLNKMRSASPDIATIPYELVTEDGEIIEGEKPRIVALRAPDFFADFHPDMEVMRDAALKSGLFLLNANGELPFAAGEYGEEWWRLNDRASRCVLRNAEAYRRMLARKIEQGDPGAKPKTTRSKVMDDLAPEPREKTEAPEQEEKRATKGVEEPKKRSGKAKNAPEKSAPYPNKSTAGEDRPENPAAAEPEKKATGKSAPPRMQVVSAKSTSASDRKDNAIQGGPKTISTAPLTAGVPAEKTEGSGDQSTERSKEAPSTEKPKAPDWSTKKGEAPSTNGSGNKGKRKGGRGATRNGESEGFDSATPERLGFVGSSKRSPEEKKREREIAGAHDVQTEETAIEVNGHTIRVQGYSVAKPAVASGAAEGGDGVTPKAEKPKGGVLSIEEDHGESRSQPASSAESKQHRKARLEANLIRWLMDRWESGIKTFTETEVLEELSELEGRTVRPYEVRTSLHGFGVVGEKLENGKAGLRLTQKGAKRLRERNKEFSSAVHESR
ncbi:MobH family relaxase [Thioalkalivibrio sp. ALE16]|uniref:MobH family relaxase n=1 Tax=Thioalkalivibrio sp. ALE16 TaxID=1158172 RepID=UPI0009DB776B